MSGRGLSRRDGLVLGQIVAAGAIGMHTVRIYSAGGDELTSYSIARLQAKGLIEVRGDPMNRTAFITPLGSDMWTQVCEVAIK